VPSNTAGKYLPNRMLFYFHRALEETVGLTTASMVWQSAGLNQECLPLRNFPGGLTAVTDDLEKAVDFSCFSSLCASIVREYGEHGARAILYQCGRAALSGTLQSTAVIVGLDGPQLLASDGSDRIANGLASIARLIEMLSDMECSVDSLPQGYRFHVSACPECAGGRSGGRICHGVCGMLRGALDWLGIDPAIPVIEIQCIAGGAPGCDFSLPGAG
jgi:predicted hydrocarbon binding protein